VDSNTRDAFFADLRSAQIAATQGVSMGRAKAGDTHWKVWHAFCTELAIDPTLQGVDDPVAYLQVFLHRYRHGTIAPSKKPTRSRTAEDALRSVGQTIALMGEPDPRLTSEGTVDFRLRRQLAAYQKQDPPPHRVKPVPVTVLKHILFAAQASQLISSSESATSKFHGKLTGKIH